MIILYEDILTGLTPTVVPVLISGYSNTDYLVSQQLADAIRFTPAVTRVIEYDLGASPDEYQSFAICGHNIQGVATVEIKTGTTPGFTTATNTIAPTGSPQLYGSLSVPSTDRYVRFEITDTTNPDGFIQIGRLMVGPSFTFPAFSPVVTQDALIRGSSSRSQSDQVYGEQRYNVRQLSLEFPNIGISQKTQIDAWLSAVGFSKTFVVHLDEAFDYGYSNLHVNRDGDAQSYELNTAKIYTTRFNLLEAF